MPTGSGNAGKSVQDEIASIEKLMGDRSSDYWRGPKAAEIQQRYRSLIDARDDLAVSAPVPARQRGQSSQQSTAMRTTIFR